MASLRRGKRKSDDFIYEINENDVSPERPEMETDEPSRKILKTEIEISVTSQTNEHSNLEIDSSISQDNLLISEENNMDRINSPECATSKNIQEVQQNERTDILASNLFEAKDGSLTSIKEISDVQIQEIRCSNNENSTEMGEIVEENNAKQQTSIDASTLINITFDNEELRDLYQTKFLKFLKTFMEFDICIDKLSIFVKNKLVANKEFEDGNVEKCLDFPMKKHRKKSKAKKELFTVDTNPSLSTGQINLRYASKFTIATATNSEVKEKMVSTQACFNCGESHALKDCPVARDYGKINVARQKFMNSKSKSARYHLEEDQKYGHLKPGYLSSNLRTALGLNKNQVPSYIYGMRMLGYPPGWLEEARFVSSNLTMFDIDGKNVRQSAKKKLGLDPDRIIEYPGFNVPLEKGYKDEYKFYNVQPYSKECSKHLMLKHFESTSTKEEDDLEVCDMDLDDEPVGKIKSKISLNKGTAKTTPRNSPSLVDLEQQKTALLQQLDEGSNSTLSDLAKKVLEGDKNTPSLETISVESPDKSEGNDCYLSTILNSSIIDIRNSSFGTPILKSNSPYSHLPNSDNFSKGVSPVIDFENLPNSTGKYEQMTGVLQKVRSTMKNLQSCES